MQYHLRAQRPQASNKGVCFLRPVAENIEDQEAKLWSFLGNNH